MGKNRLTMYFSNSATAEQDYELISTEYKMKKMKIHRSHDKKKITKLKHKKDTDKGFIKRERTDKKNGVISMKTFLSQYLGISGEALNQLSCCTHRELDMMGFEEVKRVPFEVVKGSSEFFWVIDSHGEKLPYQNPLEKLNIFEDENGKQIPYHNFASEKIDPYDFEAEYEDVIYFEEDEDELISNQCKKKRKKRR